MAQIRNIDSRDLFEQLCDDKKREDLYKEMICKKDGDEEILKFTSRVVVQDPTVYADEDRAKVYRQDAFLVVHPRHLNLAYTQSAAIPVAPPEWSNSPFQGLGGTFMLAIDEPSGTPDKFLSHDAQRKYCYDYLENSLKPYFDPIATLAFRAGALLPLKSREFDLAVLAEQVSIRYVAMLFGYPQSDLALLAETGKQIGRGLQYQMMARHFVTDPTVVPITKAALAKLVARTGDLLDIWQKPIGKAQTDLKADLDEELKKMQGIWFEGPAGQGQPKSQPLEKFKSLIALIAEDNTTIYSTTEKAILIAGLVGGAITNIRAAICIVINQFLNMDDAGLKKVYETARDARIASPNACWSNNENEKFRAYVEEAMRLNPPAAFTPRKASVNIHLGAATIPAGSLIILGVGGGSWNKDVDCQALNLEPPTARFHMAVEPSKPGKACPFSMVFGGPPDLPLPNLQPNFRRAEYTHSCIGKDLAMYVITHAARQVMILPGLAQSLDEETDIPKAKGLTKTWGYFCESYPLEYHREKLLRQQPLQTVLPVKNPVPENAAALRQILTYGAPFIEKVIQDSKVVHFASFIFLEGDSKLVLFTAYDGEFDPYIAHFAREFGPLFDRFFSHIATSPRMPIKKHAAEFVDYLKLFQQQPVGGLFVSGYPEAQTASIKWEFNKNRVYDLFEDGDA